jgi:hypothetical protein
MKVTLCPCAEVVPVMAIELDDGRGAWSSHGMRRYRIVRGAVAVAHCVQLVVATHDQQQPPTTTRRSSARSRGLRTLGGWAWACAVGYGTRCSSSRMRRRRLGLQQLDGMGFHPASPSSSAALKARCKARCKARRLAVWACTSAICARCGSTGVLDHAKEVGPLRGHGGAPFGGLVALAATQ